METNTVKKIGGVWVIANMCWWIFSILSSTMGVFDVNPFLDDSGEIVFNGLVLLLGLGILVYISMKKTHVESEEPEVEKEEVEAVEESEENEDTPEEKNPAR